MVEAARRAVPLERRRRRPSDDDALVRRVVIEGVKPQVDDGRFPIKRVVGENVVVEADVFAEGHEAVACNLLYRPKDRAAWSEVPMQPLGNDRWRGEFSIEERTDHVYTLEGWVDPFLTWRDDLAKRVDAGQDVAADLAIGAELVRAAAERAPMPESEVLTRAATRLTGRASLKARAALALHDEFESVMRLYADRRTATRYSRELEVRVDPPGAGFSTWYEMFPRSVWVGHDKSPATSRQATLRDVEDRLAYVSELGFDVLYLPPVHPIGRTHRKGKNNVVKAEPGAPGSPWAIGSEEGGHKSVDPNLGTVEDFQHLVAKAREQGIEVALDIALQCSPDHPYVREHPQWFRHRPDGTIQYAENPPKKYEDIYPFDFSTPDWRALWEELKSIFTFWIERGVRIFRVDNPHTKPFRFWEWLLAEIRSDYPDVVMLSEAFTRPRVMYYLAKLGFTQSYTYFAWRTSRQELAEYFTELTQTDVREFFRPSLWPNTPDILTAQLQTGGRAAFMSRLVLAATLSANYGIYGPAFELTERTPREPGSEEYLDSEKYEIRRWNVNRRHSLRKLIAALNQARYENTALRTGPASGSLRCHYTDNDQLLCYSREAGEGLERNIIVCVVNLDQRYTQSGWVRLPVQDWDIGPDEHYYVRDLLSGSRYTWHGLVNYVQLNPHTLPAHVFRIEREGRAD